MRLLLTKKKCKMCELQVKFYLRQYEDWGLGDSTSWDSFIGLPMFTGLVRTFTCVTVPMNLLEGVGVCGISPTLSTESLFHGFSLMVTVS